MPNGKAHMIVGGLTGTATAAVLSRNENGWDFALEVLGGAGAGAIGGKLPDSLEPALHPHHRAFFHSLAAGGATTAATRKWLCAAQGRLRLEAKEQRALMDETDGFEAFLHWLFWVGLRLLSGATAGFTTGYLSHLALDASTPMSLPLLGVKSG